MKMFRYVLLVISLVGDVISLCPHEIPGLKLWSNIDTWNNGSFFSSDSNVTITERVLLDTSAEVFSITIQAGAELVWSPDADISLSVHYVLIYGAMKIGSEDCPFPANARISLIGYENQYNISDFAEKFVGVAPGGTLEIHGKEKRSWTKLTKTLDKCEQGSCLYYRHQDKTIRDISYTRRGLVIVAYNLTTGIPITYGTFRLDSDKESKAQTYINNIINFLNGLPSDVVVSLAVQKFISVTVNNSNLFDALEVFAYGKITRTLLLRDLQQYGAWAMIVYPGNLNLTAESFERVVSPDIVRTSVSMFMVDIDLKVTAVSYVDADKISKSYVDFMTSNLSLSAPILNLADDVTTWETGDQIVVMSTDYDWTQAEVANIVECTGCDVNQIRIDLIPSFVHYGEIYKNVDMRAEVALLSRNIKIEGSNEEGGISGKFGGQLKILKNFENVHIENAEFFAMGQDVVEDRYPVHFYMCEDVDNAENPPYVRSNTFHDTYARCFTAQGTHGLLIENNVCYNSFGHGYCLQDGGEKRTVFTGNLGAGQRTADISITEKKNPATFFITNPQTSMSNNIAAGGEYAGFWFAFPTEPIGDSYGRGFMGVDEARHTAIYHFENNVAHSYEQTGLKIGNKLQPDGSTSGSNDYTPVVDPTNIISARKQVIISRFTGYKNRQNHASVSGGYITISESSFADAPEAVRFTRTSDYGQSLERSVVIGESPNVGEPSTVTIDGVPVTLNRSIANTRNPQQPIRGFAFGADRATLLQNWFGDFQSSPYYKASALGFITGASRDVATRNTVDEALYGFDDWTEGNRVFEGNDSVPGFTSTAADLCQSFIDTDGTTTTKAGSAVIQAVPFFMSPFCERRNNWGLAHCSHSEYAELIVTGGSDVVATRDDDPSLQINGVERFLVLKGFVTSYIIHFSTQVPGKITIIGIGIERTKGVRIGVCIPRNATFELRVNLPKKLNKLRKWTQLNSVAELDASNGQSYHYDAEVGVIFVKLMNKFDFQIDDYTNCPRARCPTLTILMKSGNLLDSDCTGRAYPKYLRTLDISSPAMPATEHRQRRTVSQEPLFTSTWSDPPSVWGAGAVIPFNRKDVLDL